MRDPSALTDDEQAKLAAMERGLRLAEAEHQIELRQRQMTAERLLADVSVDFEIELTRQEKGRELARRAPIAITPITAEQPPITLASTPEQPHASERPEHAATSAITDHEQKSIADLAREHVAITPDNTTATNAICSLRPDADRPSVGAAVRRARQQLDTRGLSMSDPITPTRIIPAGVPLPPAARPRSLRRRPRGSPSRPRPARRRRSRSTSASPSTCSSPHRTRARPVLRQRIRSADLQHRLPAFALPLSDRGCRSRLRP
ncbi:hypothetical protein [Streptomyces filamentosus]|uniref:hypothetical protein n=1 Tax=Streptomyces filamentosus TaxID=67294 RepID=UPI001238A9BD|nr:hypothetical protein [Streptomyces filamentosus]KAA6211765.1 hypothetical protein CP979_35940 [Streptomyces filamentosus]